MTWKNETTRQPLPAPLPMYEPVRLKHVPTFVRRRYDRDINKVDDANQVLSSEEGKRDVDGAEDDDPTMVSDAGDSVDDNEVEDDTHEIFDTEHDIVSNREDFGNSYIESSSSTYDGSSSTDIKDEVDGSEEATLIDYVDDATVKGEVVVQDNEHGVYVGFHEQDIEIVDDGTNKDGIVASWYENGSVQDEVLGDEHGNFDKEQGLPEEGDRSKGDGAPDVIHDAAGPELDDSVDYEAEDGDAQENSDTNSLEETKCEGEIQHKDGASSVEASVVEDSIKDHGHENSDIYDQDFEEEDGANNDVNIAYVDTSVNNGDHSDQHNEKDLRAEDCKRFEDGTKDVTVASNYMDETVKLGEITEKQHENLDIEQDFSEAFLNTLERDGYDVCCPNCKHIITRTMIFRRRVDYQESRTTCFTFLTSLCKTMLLRHPHLPQK